MPVLRNWNYKIYIFQQDNDPKQQSKIRSCSSPVKRPNNSTISMVVSMVALSLSATKSNPQTSLHKYIDAVKSTPVNKQRMIDIQLLKMICKEYHPFSLVENREFRNIVRLKSLLLERSKFKGGYTGEK